MEYFSTNKSSPKTSLEEAVLQGLAPDGGLYMPSYFEQLSSFFFEEASDLSFQEIAFTVAKQLMQGDLPDTDLKEIIESSITFDAPIVEVSSGCYSLELFHGPTLAFKDFGARFMAQLMSYFMTKRDQQLTILVATSGDTGSAVAHGFLNAPNIKVVLLYPSGKVSHMQEQQLTTMGGNITALEVKGTFDDCQALVKQAFNDSDLRSQLLMSSANSINIARLIPQSFYYIYSYSRLTDRSVPTVFSIPSGNFGNLTAGLFARKLGLPVKKFIAATNINDVVPSFLNTGRFEPKRSVQTISNAMDVGNPSNFARMQVLFGDDLTRFNSVIFGCSFTDNETLQCMKSVYETYGYILDPHAAVAYLGYQKFASSHPGEVQGVILETAHPAKFADVVKRAIGNEVESPDRLAAYAERQKESTLVTTSFDEFKELLTSL